MSTEANPTQTTTNESSPSSIAQSAKAGLEKALSQRPDREELVNKNILPDDKVAPSLAAARKELELSRLQNALEGKLKNRPSPDELIKEGILNQDEAPPSS